MKHILLALAIVGCVSSLVTIGTDFDASRISLIEKGKSDKQVVTRLFGTPSQKSSIDGKEQWHYLYLVARSDAISIASMSAIESDSRTKKLDVLFDSSGVVASFDYNIPGNTDLGTRNYTPPQVEERYIYPIDSRKFVHITLRSGNTFDAFIAGESASRYYTSSQLTDTSFAILLKAIVAKIENITK